MPIVKTIKLKGQDVEVRELTLENLDALVNEKGDMTIIDRVFNHDLVNESMLKLSTGLSGEEMRTCTPSDLRPLVDVFKEVNSDFLAGMKSMLDQ